MDVVLSLFWIAVEITSMLLYEGALLRRKTTWPQTFAVLLGFYVLAVVVDLELFFSPPFLVQKIFNMSLGVISALLIFSAPWYACVAAAVSSYFFLGALDTLFIYGAAGIMGMPLDELMWEKALYALYVTADKLLCLLLFGALYLLLRKRRPQSMSLRRILLAALLCFASSIGLMTVYLNNQTVESVPVPVVVFSAVLIVANGAVIYLMSTLERTAAAEKELALLNRSKALQAESYQALEKSYRAQRAASHEFKHQLQLIGDLLRDGHSGEALAYIGELQGQQSSRLFAANTGNTIIDAILNEKYQRAREGDVDIRYKVNDLSALQLPTDALVVLLSNLLDNAIEACLRLPEGRVIECTLLRNESLLVSIRNTSPSVKIEDGQIETTKEPKAEHGFGLRAVREILRQLGGEMVFDYSEPWFQLVAEIPEKQTSA